MNETDFNGVDIYTGEIESSDIKPGAISLSNQPGVISTEQSRAMAEVQAAMLIARMTPRDEFSAYEKIKKACRRKSLAETASYAYKRGSTIFTGPTIRIAEVLARSWTNITYGLKELSRNASCSTIEAFAWDLETNTRVVRTFVLNHIREKKSGNVALTSERDVYELGANMGQRRVRACILELIPGDIVEAAMAQCVATLQKDEKPLEDRIRDLLVTFSDMGVSKEMIESYLGHPVKSIIVPQFVQLMQIYKSLKDGLAKREDFFSLSEKGKGQELLSTEEKFFNEFIYNKHTATKEKINNAVALYVVKQGKTEEEIKKNALDDPSAFRAWAEKLYEEGREKDKAPEEKDSITGDPSRDKAIEEAKAILDKAPGKHQLPHFWDSLSEQLAKMHDDDQQVVKEYYDELMEE